MKRKRQGKNWIMGMFVWASVVICIISVLGSEWMQKKYGYGQDAIEATEMLKDAYKRDAAGFDALVLSL